MALHVAAQNGRVEVIYHLIKAGCDVNAKNDVSTFDHVTGNHVNHWSSV